MTGDNQNDDSAKERKERSGQETLSDADQELLAAWFDGEPLLDEAFRNERLQNLQARLEGGEGGAIAHYEQLQLVRQPIRAWVDEQYRFADGSERKVDLWQGIANRLEDSQPEQATAARPRIPHLPPAPWWEGVREQFAHFIALARPAGLSGALVTAVLIGALATLLLDAGEIDETDEVSLAAVSGGSSNKTETPAGVDANYSADRIETFANRLAAAAPETNLSSGDLHYTGNSRSRSASSLSRESALPLIGMIEGERFLEDRQLVVTSTYSRESRSDSRFRRPLRMHFESSQLISRDNDPSDTVPGGLRTDGLDIDWIKSSRPFKIVPAHGRQAPPVIWVANTGR